MLFTQLWRLLSLLYHAISKITSYLTLFCQPFVHQVIHFRVKCYYNISPPRRLITAITIRKKDAVCLCTFNNSSAKPADKTRGLWLIQNTLLIFIETYL